MFIFPTLSLHLEFQIYPVDTSNIQPKKLMRFLITLKVGIM